LFSRVFFGELEGLDGGGLLYVWLRPGDSIFVPPDFFHFVQTVEDDTVAVGTKIKWLESQDSSDSTSLAPQPLSFPAISSPPSSDALYTAASGTAVVPAILVDDILATSTIENVGAPTDKVPVFVPTLSETVDDPTLDPTYVDETMLPATTDTENGTQPEPAGTI
jgi:hypothetical protein